MAPSAEVHLALEAEPAVVVGTVASEEGPDASEWIGPLARSVITAKIWRFPARPGRRTFEQGGARFLVFHGMEVPLELLGSRTPDGRLPAT